MTDRPRPASTAGRPRHRRARRIGAVLAILVLLVVASDLFGWFYLRLPVQWVAGRLLDREVVLAAPFALHLLRREPSLALGGLRVGAPDWSDEPHLLEAQGLDLRIGWRSLAGGPLEIRHVGLRRGDVRAVRTADGRATWQFGEPREQAADDAGRPLPTVSTVDIGELTIKVADAATGLSLAAGLRTETEGGGEAALRAEGTGQWRDQPFGFDLFAPRILQVAGSGAAEQLVVNGRIRSTTLKFEGTAARLFTADGIDGRIAAAGDTLGDLSLVPGVVLPDTPPFRLEARVQRDGAHVRGEVGRADIGSSKLTARFDYAGDDRPPRLTGRLDAAKFVLQDLGPSIGTGGPQRPKAGNAARTGSAAKPGNRVLPDRAFDVPGLKAMNADFAVDLRELDLGTDALRPLTRVKTRLQLDDGLLSLSDLQASLAGGQVSGTTTLDASADGPPVWTADLDWKRVDLRRWIRSGEAFIVAGRFSGKTRLRSRGESTAALLDGLDGSIRGQIDGGSISHLILEAVGLDVGQAIGVLFKGSEPLTLTCALVDIGAANGRLKSNAIVLNTRDTLLFVEGRLDFRDESIDARIVPAPKDWSPFSLRTPIRIGGSLGDPDISLEPRPLALKVLAGVVLGAVAPVAALLPFIEPAAESAGEGCGPALRSLQERARDYGGPGNGNGPSAGNGAGEGRPPAETGRLRPPGTRP